MFTVYLRLPVADSYLYVSPGLHIGPVQMPFDVVQRPVHGLQHHQQIRSGAGRRSRGIQRQVADRLVELLPVMGYIPYGFLVDGDEQGVGGFDASAFQHLLVKCLQHRLVVRYPVTYRIVGVLCVQYRA